MNKSKSYVYDRLTLEFHLNGGHVHPFEMIR